MTQGTQIHMRAQALTMYKAPDKPDGLYVVFLLSGHSQDTHKRHLLQLHIDHTIYIRKADGHHFTIIQINTIVCNT